MGKRWDQTDYTSLMTWQLENRVASQATKIVALETEILTLRAALRWCSGSQDFQPEGIAYEGWRKLVDETNLYNQK